MLTMEGLVYLDHNATTPLDPRVLEAMLPWLGERHGNPSSAHAAGRAAQQAVTDARREVAALLEANPDDVVFTASGTEANNAVVMALARRARGRGEIVVSTLEHPSVLEAAHHCGEAGMMLHRVAPRGDGVVRAADLLAAVGAETRLVCLMLANNELGTLQPVAELTAACRRRAVPVLCDAVQAVGKVAVDVRELGVDFLTLGGHKFHGPLGAAALWIRPGAPFAPYLLGGGQESGRRASTINVAAVVGLGEACRRARQELPARQVHLSALRQRFEAGLTALPEVVVHGAAAPRLPHTTHAAFLGAAGQSLMARLDELGYAVSTGSACGSGEPAPSPALLSMGMAREEALSSLRVSFGMTNTMAEVEAFLPVLAREVETLRQPRTLLPGRNRE